LLGDGQHQKKVSGKNKSGTAKAGKRKREKGFSKQNVPVKGIGTLWDWGGGTDVRHRDWKKGRAGQKGPGAQPAGQ